MFFLSLSLLRGSNVDAVESSGRKLVNKTNTIPWRYGAVTRLTSAHPHSFLGVAGQFEQSDAANGDQAG